MVEMEYENKGYGQEFCTAPEDVGKICKKELDKNANLKRVLISRVWLEGKMETNRQPLDARIVFNDYENNIKKLKQVNRFLKPLEDVRDAIENKAFRTIVDLAAKNEALNLLHTVIDNGEDEECILRNDLRRVLLNGEANWGAYATHRVRQGIKNREMWLLHKEILERAEDLIMKEAIINY